MDTGTYIWATAAGAVLATLIGVLLLKVGPWIISRKIADVVREAVKEEFREQVKPLRARVVHLEQRVDQLQNGESATKRA